MTVKTIAAEIRDPVAVLIESSLVADLWLFGIDCSFARAAPVAIHAGLNTRATDAFVVAAFLLVSRDAIAALVPHAIAVFIEFLCIAYFFSSLYGADAITPVALLALLSTDPALPFGFHGAARPFQFIHGSVAIVV